MLSRFKDILKITIIVSATGVIAPLILYFSVLHQDKFSLDSSHWSNFGDFFGGVVGTFIGVLNLILFLYVTKIVSTLEERVSLNEMRNSAYGGLIEKFDKFVIGLKDSRNPHREVVIFRRYFYSFLKRMKHLFPLFEQKQFGNEVILKLNEYETIISEYQKNFSNDELERQAVMGLSSIEEEFDLFASELQKFIVSNL